MNTRTVVAGFTAGIAALFTVSYAVGNAVGPVGDVPRAHAESHGSSASDSHGDAAHAAGHGPGSNPGADSMTQVIPGGLMVSQDGYTIDLQRDVYAPGLDRLIRFSIIGPDGAAIADYEVEHEKQLHLIAVKRDFTGFQHVHPVLDSDGTWSAPVDLTAGQWRLFADFSPSGGRALTLGTDLLVIGRVEAAREDPQPRTARVDGYTVTLTGDLQAGEDAKLTLSVSQNGRPVTDLQPYLGAYGHVVALRGGDLAYLHVHPDGSPGDGRTAPGPEVVFYAAVPSSGSYHLYLDFKHDDVVRTAEFLLDTNANRAGASAHKQRDDETEHHH